MLELAPHYDLHAPFAFVNLGFGAHALGLWDLAAEYTRRAIEMVEAKNRKYDLRIARKLQRQIRSRMPAPEPAPPLEGEPGARLTTITNVVAEELSSWRGETWTRKEGIGLPIKSGISARASPVGASEHQGFTTTYRTLSDSLADSV